MTHGERNPRCPSCRLYLSPFCEDKGHTYRHAWSAVCSCGTAKNHTTSPPALRLVWDAEKEAR